MHEIAGLLCFYQEEVDALIVDGREWRLGDKERLPYKGVSSL